MAGAGRPGPGGRSRGAVAGRSGGREAGARRLVPGGQGREVVAGGRDARGQEELRRLSRQELFFLAGGNPRPEFRGGNAGG